MSEDWGVIKIIFVAVIWDCDVVLNEKKQRYQDVTEGHKGVKTYFA